MTPSPTMPCFFYCCLKYACELFLKEFKVSTTLLNFKGMEFELQKQFFLQGNNVADKVEKYDSLTWP